MDDEEKIINVIEAVECPHCNQFVDITDKMYKEFETVDEIDVDCPFCLTELLVTRVCYLTATELAAPDEEDGGEQK